MSGVWMFNNGVIRLVENPGAETGCTRRKALIHKPSNEVISSYKSLQGLLFSLGWERYYDEPSLIQFHKRSSDHLISLPKEFAKFNSVHMYDIVIKNRNMFEVRDM